LALGRLFGCTRLRFVSARRRWLYVCLAPGLPALLLARMAAKAFRSPRSRLRYLRALPALTTLVVAWSWGEWLGYLTRRAPKEISLAQQILDCERGADDSNGRPVNR